MGYNSICNDRMGPGPLWMCNEGELGGMQELKKMWLFSSPDVIHSPYTPEN